MKTHTYRDLVVWQKSVTLVIAVYKLTQKFPKEETYGLVSQMRRSAVSISSNIAEGKLRGSEKEFKQFLSIAFGLGGELETQFEIAKRLQFVSEEDEKESMTLLDEIMKMLNAIISKLTPNA